MALTRQKTIDLNLSYYGIVKYSKVYDYNQSPLLSELVILLPDSLNHAIQLCIFDDDDLEEPDESRTYIGNSVSKEKYSSRSALVRADYINEEKEFTGYLDDELCFIILADEYVYQDLKLKENDYVIIKPELVLKQQILWLEKIENTNELKSKWAVGYINTPYNKLEPDIDYSFFLPIPYEIAKIHNIIKENTLAMENFNGVIIKQSADKKSLLIKVSKSFITDNKIDNGDVILVSVSNNLIEIEKL